MRDETKTKVAAAIIAPFLVMAVLLNAIWIDLKRPVMAWLKATAASMVVIVPVVAIYYWLNGTFPY